MWVEVRDKDSGLALERRQLVSAQDYELNCIQGRLVLNQPLSSVASSGSLVASASAAGNPVYLLVTYEYAPGTSSLDTYSSGGQGNWWINDHLRLGLTGFRQGGADQRQSLDGADVVLRATQGTYLKGELARSQGPGSGQANSITGGFDFVDSGTVGERAQARRIEGQVDHRDIGAGAQGTSAFYYQDRERGFSGAGPAFPGRGRDPVGRPFRLPAGRPGEARSEGRHSPVRFPGRAEPRRFPALASPAPVGPRAGSQERHAG